MLPMPRTASPSMRTQPPSARSSPRTTKQRAPQRKAQGVKRPGFESTWRALDQEPLYTVDEEGRPCYTNQIELDMEEGDPRMPVLGEPARMFLESDNYRIVAALLEISQDGGSSWETLTHPQQINDNSLVRRTIATDEEE